MRVRCIFGAPHLYPSDRTRQRPMPTGMRGYDTNHDTSYGGFRKIDNSAQVFPA
jgi:hypothetical protein